VLYPLSEIANKPSTFCELTLKLWMLDMVSALQFLHGQSKLVHLNISPSSIFVTPQLKWKLGGL